MSNTPDENRLRGYQRAVVIKEAVLETGIVEDCLVIVTFGTAAPFREPAVSVLLTLRDDEALSDQDLQIIAAIVISAVPNLEYRNITITDTNFNTYNYGG